MQETIGSRTRKLRIIAQDPAVKRKGKLLTASVDVPAETLAPGPWGYRVHVIDYDASTRKLYRPPKLDPNGRFADPYATASDETLMSDPGFHAQNAYAIVMRTLARFEQALGRRVSWGFRGHQLNVAPHAFADANAFYSEHDQALLFGYFPGRKGTVFSCLSHDVVAHETTHALLDGIRQRYTDPSSPDQAGFHEGFSDVVALLSVFALKDVVRAALDHGDAAGAAAAGSSGRLIASKFLTPERLRRSILFGLAEQMGEEMSAVRGRALRKSAELKPSKEHVNAPEFMEPHRRGEILVAAMLNAFIGVWSKRMRSLGEVRRGHLDRERVVEEGANAADYLLTMSIRALDYCTPVHVEYCDFLSALLTADHELRPDDSTFGFRAQLRESFKAFGLPPSSKGTPSEPGIWLAPFVDKARPLRRMPAVAAQRATDRKRPRASGSGELVFDRVHFEPLTRDPDEVFKFIWDNRDALHLYPQAYSRVLSVRPCLRIGPDGFALRETVAEFVQTLTLRASELKQLDIRKPEGMPLDTEVKLHGGGALIFDEFGRLKFNIHNRVHNAERQTVRLEYLWKYGYFKEGSAARRSFAHMHRQRARSTYRDPQEQWT